MLCWHQKTPAGTSGAPVDPGTEASGSLTKFPGPRARNGFGVLPRPLDWLTIALLAWLFASPRLGWESLLVDGDTGWHIRAGQWILEHRQVPTRDLFSFSKPNEPWLAWEWLSEVIFAGLHQTLGLKGVVWISGVTIVGTFVLVAARAARLGATGLVNLFVVLFGVGASTIHQLARPHVFSWFLLAYSLWLIEQDLLQPTRRIWLLVPLAATWVNLHGGVFGLLACLGCLSLGAAVEALTTGQIQAKRWCTRYGVLCVAASAATLLNPYGWRLHIHVLDYLRAGWIRRSIQEFQPLGFSAESHFHFELLLIAGLLFTLPLASRRGWAVAALVLFWAHWALVSARHVPLYAIVACPWIATELTHSIRQLASGFRTSCWLRALVGFSDDLARGLRGATLWTLLAFGVVVVWPGLRWPNDFPAWKFPVAMAARWGELLSTSRVLCPDEWADYLIYRHYPRQRVFLDGRSDFYGRELVEAYLSLASGKRNWAELVARHRFDVVWVPPDWAIASLLLREPHWQVVEQDAQAVLLARRNTTH